MEFSECAANLISQAKKKSMNHEDIKPKKNRKRKKILDCKHSNVSLDDFSAEYPNKQDSMNESFTSNLKKRSAISDAMVRENEPNELNNSLVHGRGSKKAKHHLINTEYANKVAGVSDTAIGESSEVVNGKKKDERKRKRRKKSHVESAENLGNGAIVKGQLPESGSMRTRQDGTVEHVNVDIDPLDVNESFTSNLKKRSAISDAMVRENEPNELNNSLVHGRGSKKAKHHLINTEYANKVAGVSDTAIGESSEVVNGKKKDERKRKRRKKSHVESAENLGNGATVKGQLPESGSMRTRQDGTVEHVNVDIDPLDVNESFTSNLKKRSAISDAMVRENEPNELNNSLVHGMGSKKAKHHLINTEYANKVAGVSDTAIGESSEVVNGKKKDERKRKRRKKSHVESAENLGNGAIDKGQLPESGSMRTRQDGTVEHVNVDIDPLNVNSLAITERMKSERVIIRKERKYLKCSLESVNKDDETSGKDNLHNMGLTLKSRSMMSVIEDGKVGHLSDLQVTGNSGIQLPSGEVGKMVEHVHLTVSRIRSPKKKKKEKVAHKNYQGSGCDISLSNLGGPLNVDRDSVTGNSGVQLPSGEVGKMFEHVDLTVSRIRSPKRKKKEKVAHKNYQGSGCDISLSNLGGPLNVDRDSVNAINQGNLKRKKEKKKPVKHMKILQPGMRILHTESLRKKLLILDINGILVDIVSVGRTIKRLRSHGVVPQKQVHSRPFYMDFLQFCFERFNVVVWSSRTKKNLNRVLFYLMGNLRNKFLFVWDQSHCTNTGFCTLENEKKPLFLKELKNLWGEDVVGLPWEKGWYNESNTLLLDDSPYKALRNPPHTAIFPHPYQFSDINDVSLGPGGDLRVYLERLASADNVQNFVKQNPFGQTPLTENSESWEFYLKIIENNASSHTPVIAGA